MEWQEEWYSQFDVDWVKSDLKMPPGQARNIGLNHFYSGDDDYCIILDDDTFIEVNDDIIDWLQQANEKDCKDLWMISVPDVDRTKYCYERSDTHHLFRVSLRYTSGVFIVKNSRKHTKDKGLFFSPHFIQTEKGLIYGEDGDFLIQGYENELQPWEVYSSLANKGRDRDVLPSTWLFTDSIKLEQERWGGKPPGAAITLNRIKNNSKGIFIGPDAPLCMPVVDTIKFRVER